MPPVAQTLEEKKQRRLLTTLISLNVLVVLGLIGGFSLGMKAMMMKVNPAPKPKVEHPLPGPTLQIFNQIYNLGETNRYMKVTMELELEVEGMDERARASFLEEIRRREPHIRDLLISEISGKTYREVSTPQGKEQLKEELRLKINTLLSRGELREVMFTSFAVQ